MVNWYEDGANVQAANAGVVTTNQFSVDNIEFFGSPAHIIVDVFGIFTRPGQGFVPEVHESSVSQAAGAAADWRMVAVFISFSRFSMAPS